MLRYIVITPETEELNETEKVVWLLENGAERIHLRKPTWDDRQLKTWLEKIPSSVLDRITIHNSVHLAESIGVGGVHVNRNVKIEDVLRLQNSIDRKLIISCSCHSFEELKAHSAMDYCFLSPIFDSVSKVGYKSAFYERQLMDAKRDGLIGSNVFALGGITTENLNLVDSWGFGGVAVLGSVWQNLDHARFKSNWLMLRNRLKTIEK